MNDYHGDGMNIADQLRESVIESKRLRADLDDWQTACQLLNATVEHQDAAIARVRELCASPYDLTNGGNGWVKHDDVLRALEPNGGASG